MNAQESGQLVLVERPRDGIALLRLNRPTVRNALNLALRRALATAFDELGYCSDIRCIVLTGDDRAFSAGADLQEYVDATPADIVGREMQRLWGAIASCPKPLVAAVNGYALGGGCELAMHADIVIAGQSARFGQPEVKIGLIPGGGATQRLTRVAGKFVAMKLLLTGQTISADEASSIGLVSGVVADDRVLDESLQLAEEIAALPPLAVRQIKEMVLESMNVPLDAGLFCERKAFQMIFGTEDKTEGIRAFLEKRKPNFTGS